MLFFFLLSNSAFKFFITRVLEFWLIEPPIQQYQATVLHSFSLSNFSIYQIRGHLRTSPKIAVKLEGALHQNYTNVANGRTGANASASILHPACVANGSFISQTFQILYRNEDVPLFDMAQFRLHVLVDSHKVSGPPLTTNKQFPTLFLLPD